VIASQHRFFACGRDEIRTYQPSNPKPRESDKRHIFQISVAINQLQKKTATKFAVAAIDTVSKRIVIGRQQELAYSLRCGSALQLTPFPSIFVFADQRCKSLGTIKICIPTPQGGLYLDMDVVDPDIPLLYLDVDVVEPYIPLLIVLHPVDP
jgi:hypothetical protein